MNIVLRGGGHPRAMYFYVENIRPWVGDIENEGTALSCLWEMPELGWAESSEIDKEAMLDGIAGYLFRVYKGRVERWYNQRGQLAPWTEPPRVDNARAYRFAAEALYARAQPIRAGRAQIVPPPAVPAPMNWGGEEPEGE